MYLAHIEPFLTKHEVEIDKAIANARIRAKEVGLDYLNRAIQILRTTVVGTLAVRLSHRRHRRSISNALIATQPQLFRQSNEDGHDPNQIPPPHLMNQPPSLADPASGAAAQLFSLAGNVFRQYGPAAVAAGSALLHPMKGRAPSVRRVDPHQQQQSDIGLGNASGYDVTTSSRAPSSTKPGVRSRREPSATESVSTVSSPGSYASSSHPSSPQYQPPQRQQAMGSRSVSAGQVPSFGMSASSSSHTISGAAAHASGPSRIHSSSAISSLAQQQQQSSSSTRDGHQSASNSSTSSSNGGGGGHGFEQIRREELGDYAERPNTTRSRVSSSSQGNGGASGAAAGESPAKKGWFS